MKTQHTEQKASRAFSFLWRMCNNIYSTSNCSSTQKNVLEILNVTSFFLYRLRHMSSSLSSFLCGKDWIMSANLTTSCHYSSNKKSPWSPISPIPWTQHVFGDDEVPLKRATTTDVSCSMKPIHSFVMGK